MTISAPTWLVHWKTHQFAVQEILLGSSKWSWNLNNDKVSSIFNVSKASIRKGSNYDERFWRNLFHKMLVSPTSHGRMSSADIHRDQLLLVLGGMYIFIQKSMIWAFQWKTYSLHKGRPFVKPMVVVFSSGIFHIYSFMISRLKQCFELVGKKRLVGLVIRWCILKS